MWVGQAGSEVSYDGHHEQRGKNTMGSALDEAVVDFAQLLTWYTICTQYEQIPIIFVSWLTFGQEHFGGFI